MTEEKIERINVLARKAKAEGLTDEERAEQQALRREFIDDFKRNLRGTLDNISIQENDGSITNLGEKYGNKGAKDVEKLLADNAALFAGGELSQEQKDEFFQAVMVAYVTCKEEAKKKFGRNDS